MIRMVKAGWVSFIVLLSLIIGTFECQLHDTEDFVLSTALFLEPRRVPGMYQVLNKLLTERMNAWFSLQFCIFEIIILKIIKF